MLCSQIQMPNILLASIEQFDVITIVILHAPFMNCKCCARKTLTCIMLECAPDPRQSYEARPSGLTLSTKNFYLKLIINFVDSEYILT